jgi:Kef-type K+ transport system membrane component KefB
MPPTHLTADPFPGILLLLAFLWLAAKIGGELALRLKRPVVAGELAAGIIITGQAGIIGALMLTTMIGPVGLGRVLIRNPN